MTSKVAKGRGTQGGKMRRTVLSVKLARDNGAAGAAFLVRLIIGCLFLASSLPKLRQPYDFLANVYDYELVGPKVGMLVAMVLPWLELILGICLLGGILVSGALLSCTLLGLIFTFAQSSALYRGLDITCGCFGTATGGPVSHATVLRTCALTLAAGIGYLLSLVFTSKQRALRRDEGSEAVWDGNRGAVRGEPV